jgi:hypothetical protein
MGRVLYRKEGSEGAKLNTDVERTNQAPVSFPKTSVDLATIVVDAAPNLPWEDALQ